MNDHKPSDPEQEEGETLDDTSSNSVLLGERKMPKMKRELAVDQGLAREAQALVALAFRNGPIEDIHAGRACPTCSDKDEYSRITDGEMKLIMKKAVDTVYALLWIRTHCSSVYEHVIRAGNLYSRDWDLPENSRDEIETITRFAEKLGQ